MLCSTYKLHKLKTLEEQAGKWDNFASALSDYLDKEGCTDIPDHVSILQGCDQQLNKPEGYFCYHAG